MKNVISFSGGRTSAYLCYLAKQGLIEDPAFVFCDTGAEHPATYDFVRKCNDYFDLNLVCLRSKMSPIKGVGVSYEIVSIDEIGQDLKPFDDLCKCYAVPFIASPICTDRMKAAPFTKYCNNAYGKGNYLRWLGIRIDEHNRLKNLVVQEDAFMESVETGFRYLAEISDFAKQDVIDWWAKMPFDLGIDEHLGNCVFCIKKGDAKLALAARQEPDMADAFIAMVKDPENREKGGGKIPNEIMYRGHNSLESIIAKFSDFSEDELKERIYRTGGKDTGSCSESCEAFSDNYDFFEDEKEE